MESNIVLFSLSYETSKDLTLIFVGYPDSRKSDLFPKSWRPFDSKL